MEKNLEKLLDAGGVNFAIAYEIINGVVERALELSRNHPKYSECNDTCLMYWIEDNENEGDEVECSIGRNFCEDCIDSALEVAENENPSMGLCSVWTYSNCTENDDFESCDVCGIHFQNGILWTNGFDHYDETPPEITKSCEYPQSLYEFERLFHEGLHCWQTSIDPKNNVPTNARRWRKSMVIQLWRIASNFCEAFS